MRQNIASLLWLASMSCAAASSSSCPPLGPSYPAPKVGLATDAQLKAAWSNLTASIDMLVPTNAAAGGDDAFLSVGVASVHEKSPLFEYRRMPSKASVNATGSASVTQDTVFRLGSITKVFTVLALTLHEDKFSWDDPITKHVPELRCLHAPHRANGTKPAPFSVEWHQITLRALSSQLAGIPRDIVDLSVVYSLPWSQFGFPVLGEDDVPPCGAGGPSPGCDRADFLKAVSQRSPTFEPSRTPAYSNAAFSLLGLALESIVGRSFEQILATDIFEPLNMTHASVDKPPASAGAIPAGASGWDQDDKTGRPSGGIYCSTADLLKFGQGILSAKLLSRRRTLEWLKPHSHTSSLTLSVGQPWEIIRSDSLTQDGRVVDLYTKNGAIGKYQSLLVLVPDYDVVLTVLLAGDSGSLNAVAETVLRTLVPCMEDVAEAEAQRRFAGRYQSGNSSSSLTVAPADGPGLRVSEWINDGHDILQAFGQFFGPSDLRLYPTGLHRTTARNGRAEAFRGVFEHPGAEYDGFLNQCNSWYGIDGNVYGQKGLDEFVFYSDDESRVVAVEPSVLRKVLNKAS